MTTRNGSRPLSHGDASRIHRADAVAEPDSRLVRVDRLLLHRVQLHSRTCSKSDATGHPPPNAGRRIAAQFRAFVMDEIDTANLVNQRNLC